MAGQAENAFCRQYSGGSPEGVLLEMTFATGLSGGSVLQVIVDIFTRSPFLIPFKPDLSRLRVLKRASFLQVTAFTRYPEVNFVSDPGRVGNMTGQTVLIVVSLRPGR